MQKYLRLLLIALFCLSCIAEAYATHIRAGDLTIRRLDNTALLYEITVILYRDVQGVPAGDGLINFGDGSDPEQVPPRSLGFTSDRLTEILEYRTQHIFPAAGTYRISYFERNRNAAIRNMDVPSETPFYIESEFLLNPILGLNSSPILLIPPVLQARIGQKYVINAGAFDVQGDSLSYRLTICMQGRDTPVQNYRFPDDLNEPWTREREDCSIPGEFFIDPVVGDVVWDAPNEPGEYNIAFFVDEWRDGVKIGSVNRDMQIIVKDVINLRPVLTIPQDTCVVAGEILEGLIEAEDQMERVCASGDRVAQLDLIDLFLRTLPDTANRPSFDIVGLQPPVGREQANLTWSPTCDNIRREPYQFTFEALDNPRPNDPELNATLQLSDSKTWRVKVVGPPPQNLQTEADELNGTVRLTWDSYACDNVDRIQIFRKVGSFDFQPVCETGLPEFTGYRKVAEVEGGLTSFVDQNLERGSNYCYRIYATFKEPRGGESLASEEACVFIPATVYMTNVSVDRTGLDDGEITVRWTQPFDPNLTEPVSYRLFRGEGLSGRENVNEIPRTFSKTDTTFIDTGLNTLQQTYHYWVVTFADQTPVDTTRTASTVALRTRSQLNDISLTWEAEVPWSITSMQFPTHNVFRKLDGEPDDSFQLIGTPEVSRNGLVFTDDGSASGEPLEEGQVYCYRVETVGTYEFDGLPEPLLNFSPTICSSLLDTIPPCPPALSVSITDCAELEAQVFPPDNPCPQDRFEALLTWVDDMAAGCDDDIATYNVYFSERPASSIEEFSLIAQDIVEKELLLQQLSSFAGCYAVTAVDNSGNESTLSNIVCLDNECPLYELPNAFTPNGDGINDFFIPMRCPRFVRSVDFKVVNRWGETVFSSKDDIQINWDGRSDNGNTLPSGTYFYQADVQFFRLNEEDESLKLKGWIQLMRQKGDPDPIRPISTEESN